jgi:hypothetical protein
MRLTRTWDLWEDRRRHRRLIHVPVNPYGDDRLARLLRLLRPAPLRWIANAQRIAVEISVLEDRELAELGRKLESDPRLRERFASDPVAAAHAAGMPNVALGLERELRELVALAERIANDSAYRAELDADPVVTLLAAGVPAATAEPLLRAIGVENQTLAKLPEVVAHQYEPLPRKARLLTLLLGSAAIVDTIGAGRGKRDV